MKHISPWKRYLDDTITVIKLSSIEHVLSILNSFHQNIEFTYELQQNGKIDFFNVMLIRTNDTLQTTIYRKSTHNGVYLHWNSFAPRTLLIQAYKICSTKRTFTKWTETNWRRIHWLSKMCIWPSELRI